MCESSKPTAEGQGHETTISTTQGVAKNSVTLTSAEFSQQLPPYSHIARAYAGLRYFIDLALW